MRRQRGPRRCSRHHDTVRKLGGSHLQLPCPRARRPLATRAAEARSRREGQGQTSTRPTPGRLPGNSPSDLPRSGWHNKRRYMRHGGSRPPRPGNSVADCVVPLNHRPAVVSNLRVAAVRLPCGSVRAQRRHRKFRPAQEPDSRDSGNGRRPAPTAHGAGACHHTAPRGADWAYRSGWRRARSAIHGNVAGIRADLELLVPGRADRLRGGRLPRRGRISGRCRMAYRREGVGSGPYLGLHRSTGRLADQCRSRPARCRSEQFRAGELPRSVPGGGAWLGTGHGRLAVWPAGLLDGRRPTTSGIRSTWRSRREQRVPPRRSRNIQEASRRPGGSGR